MVGRFDLGRQLAQGCVEPGPPAHAIDRLEAARGHEPCPGILGHAVSRPALDGGDERIVERLFGAVEVAEQANQRREDTPRLGAVDGLDRPPRVVGSLA